MQKTLMEGTTGLEEFSNTFIRSLPPNLKIGDSYSEQLLLREYGAVFVARGGVLPPDRIVFANADEVERFQSRLDVARESMGGFMMELQATAMDALTQAIARAGMHNFSITPRAEDSARRGYDQTVALWVSRVDPALKYWVEQGRIANDEAIRLRALSPSDQVSEVLRLEQQEIWFSKDLSKSIIYSVAPPGTSQHLSMLAFDVKEHDNPTVRAILADHGWYQTVTSDLPHFTYLGVPESELFGLGLKKLQSGDRTFWIPE